MALDDDFNPDELYDQFPSGPGNDFGPEQGFGRWVKLNDPTLFTEEAKGDPVIAAFLSAPISFNYVQFKSSTRESEYFIHKPHRAMTGEVTGIEGSVAGYPYTDPRIPTLVMNHQRTLAKKITRAIVVGDGEAAGQIIHKGAADEGE